MGDLTLAGQRNFRFEPLAVRSHFCTGTIHILAPVAANTLVSFTAFGPLTIIHHYCQADFMSIVPIHIQWRAVFLQPYTSIAEAILAFRNHSVVSDDIPFYIEANTYNENLDLSGLSGINFTGKCGM